MIIHRISGLTHHEKLFLFALRELGADQTPIKLSYDELGSILNCTRGTISRVIKTVSELGYVHVSRGEGRASNIYQLTL